MDFMLIEVEQVTNEYCKCKTFIILLVKLPV